MVKVEDNVIYITRGDSACFNISATYEDCVGSERYEFQPGDQLMLSVKKTNKDFDEDILIQVTDTVTTPSKIWPLYLAPEDTKQLKFDTYYYDVQLTKEDGWVDTIVTSTKFKVGVEIG